jgi:cytochrome bd-type quinol oxidase subunit 2
MRLQLTTAGAAVAVWLASPALNSAYVPWGARGATEVFVIAIAIWLISTYVMGVEFRRSDTSDIENLPRILFGIILFLIIGEGIFWLTIDEENNKSMLLRQQLGIVLSVVAVICITIFTLRGMSSQNHKLLHFLRWVTIIIVSFAALELVLFTIRNALRQTLGYYAMDCSMFAVAIIYVTILISGLQRQFGSR